jgi:hypothetical protein
MEVDMVRMTSLVIVLFVAGCDRPVALEATAEAAETPDEFGRRLQQEMEESSRRFEERMEEHRRRADERRAEHEAQMAAALRKQAEQHGKRRKVRRWVWESPAETRAKLWNVPQTEDTVTTATGLLRICMTEADGHEADCIGIWQVLNNIRSSGCDRRRIRRITECDEDGETLLSVMRRAQRFALGVAPPRSARTRWIAQLELTCVQPEDYTGSERQWASQYARPCAETSDLVQRLVAGRHVRPVIRGARAIAWGGRCENDRGACDDPLACSRGLARIPGLETHNAFWCRPGSPGCSPTIDPICAQFARPQPQPTSAEEDGEAAPSPPASAAIEEQRIGSDV